MASPDQRRGSARLLPLTLLFVQWEEDEASCIVPLLITRRWHFNGYSAFSTCATSTLKLAPWFWKADRPAVARHRTDVIITRLSGLEHCEGSDGQNGRQRVHWQCCCALYTFVLFVKFTSSAQPEQRPSANAVTLGTQLVSEQRRGHILATLTVHSIGQEIRILIATVTQQHNRVSLVKGKITPDRQNQQQQSRTSLFH